MQKQGDRPFQNSSISSRFGAVPEQTEERTLCISKPSSKSSDLTPSRSSWSARSRNSWFHLSPGHGFHEKIDTGSFSGT